MGMEGVGDGGDGGGREEIVGGEVENMMSEVDIGKDQ